ncbi:hypothetical protein ALMP_42620 [Streptomyces sp. A012304]|nr:hypothetical protein ALMP_42620 [Streptomyces sp. A012304]
MPGRRVRTPADNENRTTAYAPAVDPGRTIISTVTVAHSRSNRVLGRTHCRRTGFGPPTAFRERFRKVVGTSPQGYRRAFRSGLPGA